MFSPRKEPAAVFPPESCPHLETDDRARERESRHGPPPPGHTCPCGGACRDRRTHRRSTETKPPDPPDTTAAPTRTSRRPPRSRCTRRLQRSRDAVTYILYLCTLYKPTGSTMTQRLPFHHYKCHCHLKDWWRN